MISLPPETTKPIKEIIRRPGDQDHDKTFCVFAVRINKEGSRGQRKLVAGKSYYLMQGFQIAENQIYVEKWMDTLLRDSVFNRSYKQQTTRAHINFSAIVGMNGSGKSTLVEYMLRLINNISASVFGEYKVNAATDRLHYIDGVNGELFYYSHGYPYCLTVVNDSVTLRRYDWNKEKSDTNHIVYDRSSYVIYENYRDGMSENGHLPFRDNGIRDIDSFFYTLVSNQSIYAYNANDYKDECGTDDEERSFEKCYNETHKLDNPKDIETKEYPYEEKCWLHGLFHKNDGYQIPLVLNPFRRDGCIDINIENKIAKERLVNLLVSPRSGFRHINGHLEVTGLTLTRSTVDYGRGYLNSRLEVNIGEGEYNDIRDKVFKLWMEVLELPAEHGQEKQYYEDTKSYVCYKTLKIAKQYRQYQHFFDGFQKKEWLLDEYDIQQLIDNILLDSSHITGKLFQALDYLIFDIYSDDRLEETIPLFEIKKQREASASGGNAYPQTLHSAAKVCLIPSPIFKVTINLNDEQDGSEVDFETLSSGEKQLTYAVSSLLYHLNNIDSVSEDNNKWRIIYKNVNIILEEVELYFHPELQKQLVKYIIDGIGQLEFVSIQGINIILVTHSPFVLSDIPSSNILALKKDGTTGTGIHSFGSNIHEMLKDSFFLETGWIGDFAKFHIKSIIEALESKVLDNEKREKIHRLIMLIDEPVVRTLLLEKYKEVCPETSPAQRIAELTKELEELKKENHNVETE